MRAVSLLSTVTCALAIAACTSDVETGRASYANLCAGCHGSDGRGDGPNAWRLAVHPADLTDLSVRNGGDFPRLDVLSRVDSYAKGEAHDGQVPELWQLLDGRTVLVETGQGILTPTPEPLVALTAYIESIQRDRVIASGL